MSLFQPVFPWIPENQTQKKGENLLSYMLINLPSMEKMFIDLRVFALQSPFVSSTTVIPDLNLNPKMS